MDWHNVNNNFVAKWYVDLLIFEITGHISSLSTLSEGSILWIFAVRQNLPREEPVENE